jgi:hypothetical protein
MRLRVHRSWVELSPLMFCTLSEVLRCAAQCFQTDTELYFKLATTSSFRIFATCYSLTHIGSCEPLAWRFEECVESPADTLPRLIFDKPLSLVDIGRVVQMVRPVH